MRVISGTAKGRRLVAPSGDMTRPATDRLKEALFNILFDVDGDEVLDLYAGAGTLGIEALSRGAAHVTFVEAHGAAVAAIEKNLTHCGLAERATIRRGDVLAAVQRAPRRPWDLVFCDPPYEVGEDDLAAIAAALGKPGVCSATARLAIERRSDSPPPPLPDGFVARDPRRYGQTTLHLAERG